MKLWLKSALIRALKTFCQTAVSLITVGNLVTEIDWISVASISTTAAAVSILTSLAGLPEVDYLIDYEESNEYAEDEYDTSLDEYGEKEEGEQDEQDYIESLH